ncbi:hypothetical protein GN958_ATG11796 [Phytophthora infestans]|nr:hypothetical protein GN958_ATG11796 [Phytophthora infestans]
MVITDAEPPIVKFVATRQSAQKAIIRIDFGAARADESQHRRVSDDEDDKSSWKRVAARGQAPRGKEHDSEPLYSSDLEGSLYPQQQPDRMVTWPSPRGGEGVAWRATDGVDVLIGAEGVMGDEVWHHETQRTSAHGGTTGRRPSSGRPDVSTMGWCAGSGSSVSN